MAYLITKYILQFYIYCRNERLTTFQYLIPNLMLEFRFIILIELLYFVLCHLTIYIMYKNYTNFINMFKYDKIVS